MISDSFAMELRAVLAALHHLLGRIRAEVGRLEHTFKGVDAQSDEITRLYAMLAEIERQTDLLRPGDLDDFDREDILHLYEERKRAVASELRSIGFTTWTEFVQRCTAYNLEHGLDPLLPYEAILTDSDLKTLSEESYEQQLQWDRWDYIFVGASGILGALTDFLLVRIPRTIAAGQYAGQLGSPLTAWLKRYDTTRDEGWFADWARELERRCRVPYDAMRTAHGPIAGMHPRSHRLQSLGHDPVLGFIFGVLDIMRGTITGFSYDHLTGMHTAFNRAAASSVDPVGLVGAFLRHVGHLLSDVATPMGLPAPFLGLAQGLNTGGIGEKGRTIGQIARWMYLNGYDLRHFLASGVTPFVIEALLRGYIMLRHYAEHEETPIFVAKNPKYRAMLLSAHAVAAVANAGKVALYQGNPLAINEAEWIAFIRYLIPHMKYWLFDRDRLRWEHLEQISEEGWRDLQENGIRLLQVVTTTESPFIELGNGSPSPGE